ncbi:HEAT repeat domain-containing protein [Providencia stuartii]|uniref:HEAT repeat domain-containing protein n=1 Tax=Providencia stuartii TaxID=588 RepID=UPI0034DD6BA5
MNHSRQKIILNTLIQLTQGTNNEVKLTAISILGDYKYAIQNEETLNRLIELCFDHNKEVAITALKSLGKLSIHFQ